MGGFSTAWASAVIIAGLVQGSPVQKRKGDKNPSESGPRGKRSLNAVQVLPDTRIPAGLRWQVGSLPESYRV